MPNANVSLVGGEVFSSSNSLRSTSVVAAATVGTPLWLRIWFELIEPWILLFGVLFNALVIAIMPRRSVAVAQSAKIYYVSIAVFDCYNLINSWILFSFIGDTLYGSSILIFQRITYSYTVM